MDTIFAKPAQAETCIIMCAAITVKRGKFAYYNKYVNVTNLPFLLMIFIPFFSCPAKCRLNKKTDRILYDNLQHNHPMQLQENGH